MPPVDRRANYAKATAIGIMKLNERLLPNAVGLASVMPTMAADEMANSTLGFYLERVCVKCGSRFFIENWETTCSVTPESFTHTGDRYVPTMEATSPQLMTKSVRASYLLVWLPLGREVNDRYSVIYKTVDDVQARPTVIFLIDEIAYDFDIMTVFENQWRPFSQRNNVDFIPFVVHPRNKTYVRYSR